MAEKKWIVTATVELSHEHPEDAAAEVATTLRQAGYDVKSLDAYPVPSEKDSSE